MRELGFNVFALSDNGQNAFETLVDGMIHVDVILCVIMMPRLNGIDFIKKVVWKNLLNWKGFLIMKTINIYNNTVEMGNYAADKVAQILIDKVGKNGEARILVSTGQSQFEFFEAIVNKDIPWQEIEVFHLDEYIGIGVDHRASFRKYLKERFIDKINCKKMHYINVEGDIEETIKNITKEINSAPIDIGVIGIGQNSHIAFNDPPADFDTKEAYKVVTLDTKCRQQQVDEGWFPTIDDVPLTAISATVYQILKCQEIISIVPHKEKAEAIKKTFETKGISHLVPSTVLKSHQNWYLYLDDASASLLVK